jgi:oxygen-independent coproporphyrinogen-3 oxidase
MNAHCRLKKECPRWSPASAETLVGKYDKRIPRYTSYPTAPHFHAGVGASDYRAWLWELSASEPLSLYLHVPFCDRLCWYCGCNTSVVQRRAPIVDYVDHLVQEIALVGTAIGKPLPVAAIHFGGGTPNILEPTDLDRIFEALRRISIFGADTEFAAEIDPRALTKEWVAAASRNGLTRASLGVQDLDQRVQQAINRAQPWSVTQRAVDALRKAGVASINLDLMYGLPHQTAETIRATIDRVLEIRPERIALFGYAHVPWMKANQKLIPDHALPDALERYRQQRAAAERLGRAGYVRVGLDHFARAEDSLAVALAKGTMRRNFQGYTTDRAQTLLGFGASAIGRLPAGYVQNAAKTPDWRAAIAAGRLPIVRGIVSSADDRVRGEIIERLMCDLAVDLDEVASRHHSLIQGFAAELYALAPMIADGLVVRDRSRLTMTEFGRPFTRAACAVFDRYLAASDHRHSRAI